MIEIGADNWWINVFPGQEEEPELEYEDFVRFVIMEHATNSFDPQDHEQLMNFLEETGEIGTFGRAVKVKDQSPEFYKRLMKNDEGMGYCALDFFANSSVPREMILTSIINSLKEDAEEHPYFLKNFSLEEVSDCISEDVIHPLLKKQIMSDRQLVNAFLYKDYSCFLCKDFLKIEKKTISNIYEMKKGWRPRSWEEDKEGAVLLLLRLMKQMQAVLEPTLSSHVFMRNRRIMQNEKISYELIEHFENKTIHNIDILETEEHKWLYFMLYEDVSDEKLIKGVENGYAYPVMLREGISKEVLEKLSKTDDILIHCFVARNTNTSTETLRRLMDTDDENLQKVIKLNPNYFAKDFHDDEIRKMAMSDDKDEKLIALLNPMIPHDIILDSATSDDLEMRLAVMMNDEVPKIYKDLI